MTTMAENPVVRSADDMDDVTFCKHMNLRHADSMAGWTLDERTDPYVLRCYRAFHRQLHHLRTNIEHEHD